jgi:hypothetical protein
MRSALWRAIPLVLVLILALAGCSGATRGDTQPSSASGLNVIVTASPNTIPANGGSSTIQVKVFDTNGQLVDGAQVHVTASPSPAGALDPASGPTTRGIFVTALSFPAVAPGTPLTVRPGTVIVTASVEDAVATTLITVF